MRKILSLIVAVLVVVSFSFPAYSSQSESEEMQKVLLLVKERIGSTDEYDKFHSSVSSSGNSEVFRFEWNNEKKNLSISANSEGVITSYHFYSSDDDDYSVPERKPTLNKMTSDEAMVKTRELISELNPEISDDIRIINNNLSESLFDDGFSFSLQRTQNGIDVIGDTGYVRVSENADNIESFNLSYTQNLKFEDSSSVIDVNTAGEHYKSTIGVKLQYDVGSEIATLEYVPDRTDVYISALDGNAVNPVEPAWNLFKNESAADSITMSGGSGGFRQLSEAELKNAEEINKLISKDEGEALLRANDLLSIGKEKELSYYNTFYDPVMKKYTYSYEFTSENENASASIDAADATLWSYSFYNGKYAEVTKDAPELASSIVEKLVPQYYKSDETLQYRYENSEKGVYSFVRYVNDIPCSNNSITLRLNADDEISYFNLMHRDVEFSSPDDILSESEACDRFFENCGYKLYYYPSCSEEGLRYADKAVLIYDFENHYLVLDAKTGTLKNHETKEASIGIYTDVSGHYAEDEIRTLAKFGIGFTDDEFRPDSLITQEDYIVLITSALIGNEGIILSKANPGYSMYFNRAQRERIIVTPEEKAPNSNVTREMAAVYMIRALGLDDVASLENIYVSDFADVGEHIGHISILNAMGVINGYGGSFNPDENLTRADAMIMLYNYLSR